MSAPTPPPTRSATYFVNRLQPRDAAAPTSPSRTSTRTCGRAASTSSIDVTDGVTATVGGALCRHQPHQLAARLPVRRAADLPSRRRPVPARPAAAAERDRLLRHRPDRGATRAPRRSSPARELRRLRQGQRRVRAGDQPRRRRALRERRRRRSARSRCSPTRAARPPAPLLENDYWLPAATLTWEVTPGPAVPPQRLEDDRPAAVPRADLPAVLRSREQPPVPRQPAAGRQRAAQRRGAARMYFAPDQRALGRRLLQEDRQADRSVRHPVQRRSSPPATPTRPRRSSTAPSSRCRSTSTSTSLPDEPARWCVIGNYTYTKSELKVAPGDTVAVFASSSTAATDFFRDGAPLTGQSDHLVNLQVGLESQDRLSQQTFLLTYASERVVSRGLNGSPPQPDIIEDPGFRLDFVAREGFDAVRPGLRRQVRGRATSSGASTRSSSNRATTGSRSTPTTSARRSRGRSRSRSDRIAIRVEGKPLRRKAGRLWFSDNGLPRSMAVR